MKTNVLFSVVAGASLMGCATAGQPTASAPPGSVGNPLSDEEKRYVSEEEAEVMRSAERYNRSDPAALCSYWSYVNERHWPSRNLDPGLKERVSVVLKNKEKEQCDIASKVEEDARRSRIAGAEARQAEEKREATKAAVPLPQQPEAGAEPDTPVTATVDSETKKQEDRAGFRVSAMRANVKDNPLIRTGPKKMLEIYFDLTVTKKQGSDDTADVRASCQVGEKRMVDMYQSDNRLDELDVGDTKREEAAPFINSPLAAVPSRCGIDVLKTKGVLETGRGQLVHRFCFVPASGVHDGECK